MLESITTKIWRRLRGKNRSPDFMRHGATPLIFLLSKKKKMALFPNEDYGANLSYLLRWYEPESVRMCKKYIKRGMNVLDIGAHVGYYSRLFSELVGKEGQVWAFEPNPESFDLLKRNVSFPKYRNVCPLRCAISDTTGAEQFFSVSAPGKHGFYDASNLNPDISVKRVFMANAITVDDFLEKAGISKIDFIKMDMEGAEPKALRGMEKTVAREKGLTLLVEFNIGFLRLAGTNPSDFLKQLKGMNFWVGALQKDGTMTDRVIDSMCQLGEMGYINVWCVKN